MRKFLHMGVVLVGLFTSNIGLAGVYMLGA